MTDTSAPIVRLRDVNAEPDENTVRALERALELARSGQLREVAIFANMTDNDFWMAYQLDDRINAIAALELRKGMMIHEGLIGSTRPIQ